MTGAEVLGADAVAADLRAVQPRVVVALKAVTSDVAEEIAARARDRMPPGLAVAVHTAVLEDADGVAAYVFLTGRDAQGFDQGFAGEVDVRAHLREIRKAFGRPIDPVEAHIAAYREMHHEPAHNVLAAAAAGSDAELVAVAGGALAAATERLSP